MERLVCVFKKMVQGESWLLPSTVPEERETACDRQVWSVARCTLTWYRENSPDLIIVCIKKIPSDSATPFLCCSSEYLFYFPDTLISVKDC